MKIRNTVTMALAAMLLLTLGAAIAHAASNKGTVKKGTAWMAKTSLNEFPDLTWRTDAVSAFAAAKRIGAAGKSSAKNRYVKSVEDNALDYVSSAGRAGKVVLAAVAAGKNPRCFGPAGQRSDYVDQLNGYYSKGRYGNTAFDHALAILALKAARQHVPKEAITFAKKQRGKHGWNYAMSASKGDDVESTALIIEALRAAGVKKKDAGLRKAYAWITYQRTSAGGYNPSDANGENQANTTAFAVRAADAMGRSDSKAKAALRALQIRSGAFRSTPSAEGDYLGIATTDSVIALSGAHYPVVKLKSAPKTCS